MTSTAATQISRPKPAEHQLGKTQSSLDPTEVMKLLETAPNIIKGVDFILMAGKTKYSAPYVPR